MTQSLLIAAAVVVVLAATLAWRIGQRLLFGWYLAEVRKRRPPEEADDVIVTYPLA